MGRECLGLRNTLNGWSTERLKTAKDSFIKELWPAQHLLGHADVLKGESAIVQTPQRWQNEGNGIDPPNAFLAERVSPAIIIAPFRALCHEIKNSLVEAFHFCRSDS